MRSSGSLLDRFGPRRVFVAGASVYAAASFAWAFVTSPLAVSAIRVGIGVGFGLTYVTLVVITGTLVPERLTNTGQTLQQICSQGLAPIVGGLVGGYVYEHIGAQPLFLDRQRASWRASRSSGHRRRPWPPQYGLTPIRPVEPDPHQRYPGGRGEHSSSARERIQASCSA